MPDRIDFYLDDSPYPDAWPYAPSYSVLNPWPDPCTYYPSNKTLSFAPVDELGSSQVTLPTETCSNYKILARFCKAMSVDYFNAIVPQTILVEAILKTKLDNPANTNNVSINFGTFHYLYYGFHPVFGHQVEIKGSSALGIPGGFGLLFNGYHPAYTWYHGILQHLYITKVDLPTTNSLGMPLLSHVFCIDLTAVLGNNLGSNIFTAYYGGTDESEGYDNIYPASRISWFVPSPTTDPLPARQDGEWIGY